MASVMSVWDQFASLVSWRVSLAVTLFDLYALIVAIESNMHVVFSALAASLAIANFVCAVVGYHQEEFGRSAQ